VVEIGAGTGALTAELAARGKAVIAIERDRDLVPLLEARFAGTNVRVLEGDAQTTDYAALFDGAAPPRVLCGNLPYQLTGRLLALATEHAARLERAVFMVQAEVAERVLAAPRTKDYGALTVFVRAAFVPTRALRVGAGAFFPPPNVESAVIALVPRADRIAESDAFRAVVKAAFAMRRKTLRNAWRALAELAVLERMAAAAGTTLDARGEELDEGQFARAAGELGPRSSSSAPR
jgi:16S rRNA (adenine1518-N6/adenine1519-N6)-dimethyltransferase